MHATRLRLLILGGAMILAAPAISEAQICWSSGYHYSAVSYHHFSSYHSHWHWHGCCHWPWHHSCCHSHHFCHHPWHHCCYPWHCCHHHWPHSSKHSGHHRRRSLKHPHHCWYLVKICAVYIEVAPNQTAHKRFKKIRSPFPVIIPSKANANAFIDKYLGPTPKGWELKNYELTFYDCCKKRYESIGDCTVPKNYDGGFPDVGRAQANLVAGTPAGSRTLLTSDDLKLGPSAILEKRPAPIRLLFDERSGEPASYGFELSNAGPVRPLKLDNRLTSRPFVTRSRLVLRSSFTNPTIERSQSRLAIERAPTWSDVSLARR